MNKQPTSVRNTDLNEGFQSSITHTKRYLDDLYFKTTLGGEWETSLSGIAKGLYYALLQNSELYQQLKQAGWSGDPTELVTFYTSPRFTHPSEPDKEYCTISIQIVIDLLKNKQYPNTSGSYGEVINIDQTSVTEGSDCCITKNAVKLNRWRPETVEEFQEIGSCITDASSSMTYESFETYKNTCLAFILSSEESYFSFICLVDVTDIQNVYDTDKLGVWFDAIEPSNIIEIQSLDYLASEVDIDEVTSYIKSVDSKFDSYATKSSLQDEVSILTEKNLSQDNLIEDISYQTPYSDEPILVGSGEHFDCNIHTSGSDYTVKPESLGKYWINGWADTTYLGSSSNYPAFLYVPIGNLGYRLEFQVPVDVISRKCMIDSQYEFPSGDIANKICYGIKVGQNSRSSSFGSVRIPGNFEEVSGTHFDPANQTKEFLGDDIGRSIFEFTVDNVQASSRIKEFIDSQDLENYYTFNGDYDSDLSVLTQAQEDYLLDIQDTICVITDNDRVYVVGYFLRNTSTVNYGFTFRELSDFSTLSKRVKQYVNRLTLLEYPLEMPAIFNDEGAIHFPSKPQFSDRYIDYIIKLSKEVQSQ